MVSFWTIKYLQFREHAGAEGLVSACRKAVYRYEEAVPVEKDLSTLGPPRPAPCESLQLVELGPESWGRRPLRYGLRSRRARAERYLAAGFRTLVLCRAEEVVGDVWYVTPACARRPDVHPHVRGFGIALRADDAYMFDMHVAHANRGGGMATYFMSSALHHLRARAVKRAYGYFAAQNTPALWVHRLLGFRELPRVMIRKVIAYETYVPRREATGERTAILSP